MLALGRQRGHGAGHTPEPLSIARQGYLFAGGKYSAENGRRVMSGQLYAEFQIPSRQTHPGPLS